MDSFYRPPEGEYVRPAGAVLLKPFYGVDNHFVRGIAFHEESLRRFPDGQELHFELVPEPGNPWDHWAVAVHAEGERIGYVAAADSGRWQDIVVAYNRREHAVYASGFVRAYGEGTVGATVLLPSFSDTETLMDELGLFEECRRVTGSLPQEARKRILDRIHYLDDADVRLIRSRSHLAPSLNWQLGTGSYAEDRYPTALYRYFIRTDREEREQRKVARDAARAVRVTEKQAAEAERKRKREEQEEARRVFASEVVQMFQSGESRAGIARKYGCSSKRVSDTLAKAGYAPGPVIPGGASPAKYGTDARDERLAKAWQAMQMQRDGFLRREIAEELECTLLTVKILLRDAKFYEDPTTNPVRLSMLMRSRDQELEHLSGAELAAALGISLDTVKDVRRDLRILIAEHPMLIREGDN